MRLQSLALILTFQLIFLAAGICEAQSVQSKLVGNQSTGQSPRQQKQLKNDKPYQLTTRIHVQKGTNKGYLIVQADLKKGSYVYSLTQAGDIPPSKLSVANSKQFKMLAGFSPDRPATVVKNDPLFQQRVEKHKDKVQFFAPIEFAAGVNPEGVVAQVTFNGQVCSDEGFCMPIRDLKLSGKFAGYFQRSSSQQAKQQSAGSGTLRR